MACNIYRIITVNAAIQYSDIVVWYQGDVTPKCQFSWSSDGVCWTNWVNLDTYKQIASKLESDFFLRIRISTGFEWLSINGIRTDCFNITFDNTNAFLQEFCGDPNLFQPLNGLDCALLLQQQLADSVVCMFGIPIYYFKTSPRQDSADYTFKEFTLHDVVDVKQIRLMISDGAMPSSNPKLTEFDFDWESDWETEISKKQFATAFGDNVYPNSNDFIYIPMMKRMWQVNAAYDEKNEGLLWHPTTWKLQLLKYNDKSNVITNDFTDIIDNWVINKYEETFGEMETNEQERQSGSPQVTSPSKAGSNKYEIFISDSIRKTMTKNNINIIDKIYCHRNHIFARNIYKFKPNSEITYQKGICGDSGTIMFLLELSGEIGESGKHCIMKFGNIEFYIERVGSQFEFSVGNTKQLLDDFADYMVMYKWDWQKFVIELDIYKYTYDEGLPKYRLKPESYYFDFENPVIETTEGFNMDYISKNPQTIHVYGYPVYLTNIKYYNEFLDKKTSIKESIKYTTTDDRCVINDLARKLYDGLGYEIR